MEKKRKTHVFNITQTAIEKRAGAQLAPATTKVNNSSKIQSINKN